MPTKRMKQFITSDRRAYLDQLAVKEAQRNGARARRESPRPTRVLAGQTTSRAAGGLEIAQHFIDVFRT